MTILTKREAILDHLDKSRPGIVERYDVGIDNTAETARLKSGLPERFEGGLDIRLNSDAKAEENAQQIGAVIYELEKYSSVCVKQYDQLIKEIRHGMEGIPVSLMSHKPIEAYVHDYQFYVVAELLIEELGGTLIPAERSYIYVSAGYPGDQVIRRLPRLKTKKLRARHEGVVPYGRLHADPVLAQIFSKMEDDEYQKLIATLNEPGSNRNIEEGYSYATWSKTELDRLSLTTLPKEVVRITSHAGKLNCSIVLAGGISWHSNKDRTSLCVKKALPRAAVEGSVGRTIHEIIDHPFIPKGLKIIDAIHDSTSQFFVEHLLEPIEPAHQPKEITE